MTATARVYDGMGEQDKALSHYREVLEVDSTCLEAIASLGTHHFYNDQPEIALRYYRSINDSPVSHYSTPTCMNC